MNQLVDDAYVIEEPSDEDGAKSSSEDELDLLLHGTPDQKHKFIRECFTGESESSSDDEFEKEMDNELSSSVKILEGSWKPLGTGASTAPADTSTTKQQYYDDAYFDSDSEEEDNHSKKRRQKQRHKIQTDEDLLYDPLEDDQNQKWINAKRKRYRDVKNNMQTHTEQTKFDPVPSSDAILNCPACMTTLCLDCQRHELYKTQYRAMFVLNCTVNRSEVLKFPEHLTKTRRLGPKKIRTLVVDPASETEMYHSVKCNECCTQVAVFDKDEVYHFFNVLASHC